MDTMRPFGVAIEVDAVADTQRPVVKTCSCCGQKYTAPEWGSLPLCGYYQDEVERLELRNCRCGSTIAIEVARLGVAS
jgi:hypothetical protein